MRKTILIAFMTGGLTMGAVTSIAQGQEFNTQNSCLSKDAKKLVVNMGKYIDDSPPYNEINSSVDMRKKIIDKKNKDRQIGTSELNKENDLQPVDTKSQPLKPTNKPHVNVGQKTIQKINSGVDVER